MTTGVAKRHWAAGSKRSIGDDIEDEDDNTGQSLHAHFQHLMELGKVRATRFVTKEVQGGGTERVTRDNKEEDVFLPSTKGIRPCYYRWCHDRGWDCEPISTGAIKKKPIEAGTEQNIVSISTYHRFWKRHYPNLKVSSRSEDICVFCFQYANRRKYNLKDAELFALQGDDGAEGVTGEEEESKDSVQDAP